MRKNRSVNYIYNIHEINQIEDLPHREVNVVYEDRRGFIWIGTLDGLFRYDGHSYKSYQLSNAKQSLKSNTILAIDEDSDSNIWNVTKVAWMVGYTDARAFRIRFKETFGVPPANYNGEAPIIKEISNIENKVEI